MGTAKPYPAPYIYSAMFNNRQDMIIAGGAGANQVRLFDFDTGKVVSLVGDLPRAVLAMGKSPNQNEFAFAC